MYIAVYDGDMQFQAGFRNGELMRAADEADKEAVAGALLVAAVGLSVPKLSVPGGSRQGPPGEDAGGDLGGP